ECNLSPLFCIITSDKNTLVKLEVYSLSMRFSMYNQRNNGPFGRNNGMFGSSRYQYQTLPYGYEGTQTSGLMSKVMGLLAFSFLFAALGTLVGVFLTLSFGTSWIVAIARLVVVILSNLYT